MLLATLFQDKLQEIYDEQEIASIYKLAFCKVKNCSFASYSLLKNELSQSEINQMNFILGQLETHKPIQYILKEAFFDGMELYVDEQVLIPRPETEELVDWISDHLKLCSNLRILDIGTGSGCIALALKKRMPQQGVNALDISENAIAIAQKNAAKHALEIEFIKDDILNPTISQKFDVIVSNPPYIVADEKEEMKAHVKHFEPVIALFVSSDDNILFYRKIIDFCQQNLQVNGRLFFEINPLFSTEIQQYLWAHGFHQITIKLDMQGKERMLFAQFLG